MYELLVEAQADVESSLHHIATQLLTCNTFLFIIAIPDRITNKNIFEEKGKIILCHL